MKLLRFRFTLSICMLSLFLLVITSALAASNGDIRPGHDIQLLAKQMDMPTISDAQKKDVSEKLKALRSDDVLTLKKLWRAELVTKGVVTQEEAVGFAAIEKVENIFSEKIKELFGENATFFNISPANLTTVENALLGNAVLTESLYSAGSTFKATTSTSANAQLVVAASTCYYDNNWPMWLTGVVRSGTTYKGGGVGRVKNDPNEWPCDFVIYIPANTYTKVTGLNSAAQNVINYSGGLSASPSKDAVIVGYGRVLLYGIPTEDWVRNYILFKK